MKNIVCVMSMGMALFLVSCTESQQQSIEQSQPQPQSQAQSQTLPQQAQASLTGTHTGLVQEVIHTTSYTYLNLAEDDNAYWIAINKTDMRPQDTVTFSNALEMRDFRSRELQRTFDVVYFVGNFKKESSASADSPISETAVQKPATENKDVSAKPFKGQIAMADLFSNPADYVDTVVRIRGKVTKINLSIMGKNWIHLTDGQHDLVVTTQDTAKVDDSVTAEGAISQDKDFGFGYFYELLMEDAKLTK